MNFIKSSFDKIEVTYMLQFMGVPSVHACTPEHFSMSYTSAHQAQKYILIRIGKYILI